jgi:selenocysteine-specific elongation factor
MLLVIDITKGIQTQTAECLIIGEITCDKMLVVLNKIDLIEEAQRQTTIEKVIKILSIEFVSYNSDVLVIQMTKRLRKTFESTKFPQTPIISCSALSSLNLNGLISTLQSHIYIPQRSSEGPFVFSVDHCFSIRGQGTVMTGTVLSGLVKINDVC